MKVEILLHSGLVTMEESQVLTFLKSADLSQPIMLSFQGDVPCRVYVRPGTRPSKPFPSSILDEFQYRSLLSGDDILRMLGHGRSLVHTIEGGPCRFSVTSDHFGRALFHIHRYNPSPSVPGYQMTPGDIESLLKNCHLGHIVRTGLDSDDKSSALVRCFVSYDSLLNDYAVLPIDRIYIPPKLHGVTLSFRQRHALSLGRRIRLGRVYAQVDAVTASVCFTAVT